ncbi:MAG: respiratory nitrate reductase subunit gamma [Deltaproteobacteria bacterium]|nr:respiratory nitrate reductase subunit gamma [Deltaproteobacteria bacterium]
MNLPNVFLFVGLPYAALLLFFVGTIQRYRNKGFKVSSLSSQFLETKALFWGTMPFHVGILVVFFGHLTAFLIPRGILLWNSNPLRLIVLHVTAFTFGLCILAGLLGLLVRRLTNRRVRMVTTRMDVALELLLLAQVVLGLWIAIGYRWGSSWFAADLTPYLRSLFAFDPNIVAVSAMPLVIKLHIVGAWTIVAIFPFTRLVHILVAPLHYLGRPYQRVMWNWDRKAIRDPATPWTRTRPKNN